MTTKNTTYSIGFDRNGNRVCRVKVPDFRAFSIQTLGNMPRSHRNGYGAGWTPGEVTAYVREYGTPHQREAVNV